MQCWSFISLFFSFVCVFFSLCSLFFLAPSTFSICVCACLVSVPILWFLVKLLFWLIFPLLFICLLASRDNLKGCFFFFGLCKNYADSFSLIFRSRCNGFVRLYWEGFQEKTSRSGPFRKAFLSVWGKALNNKKMTLTNCHWLFLLFTYEKHNAPTFLTLSSDEFNRQCLKIAEL